MWLALAAGCGVFQQDSTLQSQVQVAVSPAAGSLLSNQVVLKGGSYVCRKGWPPDSVYNLEMESLSASGCGAEPVETDSTANENTTGSEEEDTQDEDAEETSQEEDRTKDISVEVNAGWFEMGLEFINSSTNHLVIEKLTFNISEQGSSENESQQGKQFIISGGEYCGSGSFMPNFPEVNVEPLYIIPPTPSGRKVGYLKNKRCSIQNLRLLVEVPLSSEEESGAGSSADSSAERNTSSAGADSSAVASDRSASSNATGLPGYKVVLNIDGLFVTNKGKVVTEQGQALSPFRRRVVFFISARQFTY